METLTRIPVQVNGEPMEVPKDATLVDLLRQQGIDPEMPGIAVAVNERVIRRSEWASYRLEPEDRVEIITATQGG